MTSIGSKVRIKGKNTQGIVIAIKEAFAHVNTDNQNEWLPVSDLEEISDELVSRILKNDLDEGLDFILGFSFGLTNGSISIDNSSISSIET